MKKRPPHSKRERQAIKLWKRFDKQLPENFWQKYDALLQAAFTQQIPPSPINYLKEKATTTPLPHPNHSIHLRLPRRYERFEVHIEKLCVSRFLRRPATFYWKDIKFVNIQATREAQRKNWDAFASLTITNHQGQRFTYDYPLRGATHEAFLELLRAKAYFVNFECKIIPPDTHDYILV